MCRALQDETGCEQTCGATASICNAAVLITYLASSPIFTMTGHYYMPLLQAISYFSLVSNTFNFF